MSERNAVTIRAGRQDDLPQVLELVKELAAYERASGEVTNTLEAMERDGFGPQPAYGFLVAERDGRVVGLSLYYWRYSTWKGRRLWLEDIVVTEAARGLGIGKALFERTMRVCVEQGGTGMMWQVLEWNEPAIGFYRRYGARFDGEWLNCHLEAAQLHAWFEGPGQ